MISPRSPHLADIPIDRWWYQMISIQIIIRKTGFVCSFFCLDDRHILNIIPIIFLDCNRIIINHEFWVVFFFTIRTFHWWSPLISLIFFKSMVIHWSKVIDHITIPIYNSFHWRKIRISIDTIPGAAWTRRRSAAGRGGPPSRGSGDRMMGLAMKNHMKMWKNDSLTMKHEAKGWFSLWTMGKHGGLNHEQWDLIIKNAGFIHESMGIQQN